jgi:hypothetical protein
MKSEVFWGYTLRDRDRTRPRLGIWKPVWWVTTRQLAFWSLFSLLTFLSFEWGVFSCGIWNWNWDRRRDFFFFFVFWKREREVRFLCLARACLIWFLFLKFKFVPFLVVCGYLVGIGPLLQLMTAMRQQGNPCVHVSLLVRFGEKRKLLFRPCLPPHMACIRNRIGYGICWWWYKWVDFF